MPTVCFSNIIILILKDNEIMKTLNTRSPGDHQYHVLITFRWLTVGGKAEPFY